MIEQCCKCKTTEHLFCEDREGFSYCYECGGKLNQLLEKWGGIGGI